MSNKFTVWEEDVVHYLLDTPEFDDTGLLTYLKSQLGLASAVQISDKEWRVRVITKAAEELSIPAKFKKEVRTTTEFLEMLRLHLERKLEVQSRKLKEGDKIMFGSSEARIEKILPTFLVKIVLSDGGVREVHPNAFTAAGN